MAMARGEYPLQRHRSRGAVLMLAAALTSFPSLFSASPPSDVPEYKVGAAERAFKPNKAYNWRGAKTHALLTTVWYPAVATAVEQPQWIPPTGQAFASAGKAARDAAMVSTPAKLPLIVLSHGTGGSALQMAWLGTVLASRGYIAAAVNHPGNNGYDGTTAQGFSTWWERARDLSTVIDAMLADPTFGARIDSGRIGAAGFSLGGYTMIEIAGGITDPAEFMAFCQSPRADAICKSPPEFPKLTEQFDELSKHDAEFQEALRHAGDSYRDPRIRAVFAMAPALGPALTPGSLEKISIPVEIVAGDRDVNVPIESSAKFFAAHIRGAKLTILPGGVGHYVFLDTCTAAAKQSAPLICADAPGVDRDAIHARAAALALSFFVSNLN